MMKIMASFNIKRAIQSAITFIAMVFGLGVVLGWVITPVLNFLAREHVISVSQTITTAVLTSLFIVLMGAWYFSVKWYFLEVRPNLPNGIMLGGVMGIGLVLLGIILDLITSIYDVVRGFGWTFEQSFMPVILVVLIFPIITGLFGLMQGRGS
ncbi:hypothetical protein HZC00_00595 [Candidatus Kaiserbacteria bacterium]|nr:hypothetical protein [Candidatus Kaiserbacteria bacterium]